MSDSGAVDVTMLARLLNLTPRRIQQLAVEGVIPKDERGKYLLIPAVQQYVKYLQEKVGGGSGVADLSTQRARLAKEQADKVARENAVRTGQLIPADELTRALSAVAGQAIPILEALPGQIRLQNPTVTTSVLKTVEMEVVKLRNLWADITLEPGDHVQPSSD